jgi:hypothetical protein
MVGARSFVIVCLAAALPGCQVLLGFEDFEGTANSGSGGDGSGGVTNNTGGTTDGGNTGETGGAVGASGSGGTIGNTGGTGGDAGSPSTVEDGGDYVVYGDWHGYAWTAFGGLATISPSDFSSRPSGDPVCVQGAVPADSSYTSFAMLGIYLNQPPDPTQVMSVTPSNGGLAIDLTNSTNAVLRVQIASGGGVTEWCADLPVAGSAFIPWTSFRAECWIPGGVAYNGEPIVSVAVSVPGSAMTTTPFDFCINSLADQNAP